MNSPDPTLEQLEAVASKFASRRPARRADASRERRRAEIADLRREGSRYWRLSLHVEQPWRSAHARPAQYVTLKLGELAPRYIALASAPSEPLWELLIDRDSTLGVALGASVEGDVELALSRPEGDGFDLSALPEREDLVLLTTGSGVATMRGLMRALKRDEPERLRHVHLYYGERDLEAIAYRDEIALWRAAGARVFFALDHPTLEIPWRYVQEALKETAAAKLFERATFLLSGSKAMLHHASLELFRRGVGLERLRLNV